jgi:broad specificity phosphatase PhoE
MEIILARHGNTFGAGQPAVWVGSQNDLPLVASGQDQAKKLGRTLLQMKINLAAVYTGPLMRMTSYAKIALNEANIRLQPIVDRRLNEIDYGQWSGLTNAEVGEKFGKDALENWEKKSQWPLNSGWGESKQAVIERIKNFIQDLIERHASHEKILLVSSNGCLRYFLDLIPGKLAAHIENQTAKMATGHISKLNYNNEMWQLDFWNMPPSWLEHAPHS